MESPGSVDREIKPESRNSAVTPADYNTTQLEGSDSQSPSPTFAVNNDDETQLMDFEDGETEVLNFYGETEVVDFEAETQLVDDEDDCEQHMETQLLDESNHEALGDGGYDTDRTEVLSDTEGSTDIRSDEVVGHGPQSDQKGVLSSPSLKVQPASSAGKLHSSALQSGSPKAGFTSIRSALLRASGPAACSMASKWADGDYYSDARACQLSGDKISTVTIVGDENDLARTHDKIYGLQNEYETRVDSKAVRKLFSEEDDNDDHNNKSDIGEYLPQVDGCENNLAGLSYVDSQEPGEASQANALECVERFLKGSLFGLDHDVNHGIITENANLASGVKGPQCMAKKVNLKNTLQEARIFDWDDSREDEGGGDFFKKNKEALFGACIKGRKSCTEPRKPKQKSEKRSRSFVKFSADEESLNMRSKIMDSVHSEGKSVLKTSRKIDQVEEQNTKRNLMHDLDHKHSCPDSSGKQVEAMTRDSKTPDIPEVGPDTQMAAEAMEVLSMFAGPHSDGGQNTHSAEQICKGRLKKEALKRKDSRQGSVHKRVCPSDLGIVTRSRRTRLTGTQLQEESKSSVALRTRSRDVPKDVDADALKGSTKRMRHDTEDESTVNRNSPSQRRLSKRKDKKREEVPEGAEAEPSFMMRRKCSDKKPLKRNGKKVEETPRGILDGMDTAEPIAQRTRRCSVGNHLKTAGDASEELRDMSTLRMVQADGEIIERNIGVDEASEVSKSRQKSSRVATQGVGALNPTGSSLQNVSDLVSEGGKLGDLPAVSIRHDLVELCISRRKRTKGNSKRVKLAQDGNHFFPRTTPSLEHKGTSLHSNNTDAFYEASAEEVEVHLMSDRSPVLRKSFNVATSTPPSCRTPATEASPICVGNNYYTPSSSLAKELDRLTPGYKYVSPYKDLRKKRDISSIRVLFSHHLNDDVIKQQKKILGRLGVPQASSISDATHFVTDKFVRTRNMLEAIASGKPVVTPSWVESCGLASCFIDEKNYILRDAKKERELRFSMPVSLARANQHPLLQGWRVLITPNVKPSKDIILSLVKAVHGQAMERICRSVLSDDKSPDDLLVLSCEEDYEVCVPLLEKGVVVHSSELLLQGIITQKLDCERHRLFMDHVKRTRSTIWLRKDRDQFLAVKKRK